MIDNIERRLKRMSAKAAVNEDRTRWDYLKRIGRAIKPVCRGYYHILARIPNINRETWCVNCRQIWAGSSEDYYCVTVC